jgi:hypothetical protein
VTRRARARAWAPTGSARDHELAAAWRDLPSLDQGHALLSTAGILLSVTRADDPRDVLRRMLDATAKGHCDAADHEAEATVWRWRLDHVVDIEPGARALAWQGLLEALTHVANVASDAERTAALADIRAAALEAIDDISASPEHEGTDEVELRPLLDPIAKVLVRVESELGVPHSPVAAALAERYRVRVTRTAEGQTFAARHAEDLDRLRADIAESWFLERFVARHGVAPPDGWWTQPEDDGSVGRPSLEAAELFDVEDYLAFLEETEARFRADRGLPLRGEGLVSAASLARCVETLLPGTAIEREARRPWLGRQRLDILLPAFDVAIEYQGEQHYLPLEHWGGDVGLQARRELDERKRDACARAGVRLIEWRYDEPISVERVRRRLQDVGAIPLD